MLQNESKIVTLIILMVAVILTKKMPHALNIHFSMHIYYTPIFVTYYYLLCTLIYNSHTFVTHTTYFNHFPFFIHADPLLLIFQLRKAHQIKSKIVTRTLEVLLLLLPRNCLILWISISHTHIHCSHIFVTCSCFHYSYIFSRCPLLYLYLFLCFYSFLYSCQFLLNTKH